MEYLKSIKINLEDYSSPVTVKPVVPRSLKTLRNIKYYRVSSVVKKILKHPHLDVYDINPDEIIEKSDKPESEITISLNKDRLIEDYDKFEVTDTGKVQKIDVAKEIVKKHTKKIKEMEEEKELEIEINKKVPKGPSIRR